MIYPGIRGKGLQSLILLVALFTANAYSQELKRAVTAQGVMRYWWK
jgi:hypothetical protein